VAAALWFCEEVRDYLDNVLGDIQRNSSALQTAYNMPRYPLRISIYVTETDEE
jgi:hypothetical protein